MSHILIKTPILLAGYVQMVPHWRADAGEPVYLFAEDFGTPYCPIEIEVRP